MNDEVDTETYKKWRENFNRGKAIIEQEMKVRQMEQEIYRGNGISSIYFYSLYDR